MKNLNIFKKGGQNKFLLIYMISFFMLLVPTTIFAQDDINSLDSLAEIAVNNENFARGYLIRTKQIDMLSKQVNKGDANLIQLIAKRGMCLEGMTKYDEALTEEKKAIELWTEFQDTTSFTYAGLLNYLSICLADVNQINDAIENSQKSISILEKLQKTTKQQWLNMAKGYINMAESLSKAKRFKEAIPNELKGLDILEKYYGHDTTPYLKELAYLQSYLKESGNEKGADEVTTILEKEAADSKLPQVKEFTSAEEASRYSTEATYCCNYYLDHPITAPKMLEAGQFFDNWANESNDVLIPIGKFENDVRQSRPGRLCFLAFEASMITNELRNNIKFNKVLYLSAIIEMTGFYVNNKEHIGIVPTLEPFAQTYSANNQDQLIKQAEEQYDALIKFIKENSKMNLPKQ